MMRKTILITTLFYFLVIVLTISCNNVGTPEPGASFRGCNMEAGTNPASFTIDGVDYVANGVVNGGRDNQNDLYVLLLWEGPGEELIYINLKVYENEYEGVGVYTEREDRAVALVGVQNLPNAGLFVSHDPEITSVTICIEEEDTDEVKLKGYFSARIQTVNEDLTPGAFLNITNGYFRIRKL